MGKRPRHAWVIDGGPETQNAVAVLEAAGIDPQDVPAEGGIRRINGQYAQVNIVTGYDRFAERLTTRSQRIRIPKGHPWRGKRARP